MLTTGGKRALAIAAVLVFLLSAGRAALDQPSKNPPAFGFTFSRAYTWALGLNEIETFEAALSELPFTSVRLPLYWSDIEREEGEYDWDATDRLLEIAAQHKVKVTLVIGAKVPRWPECFIPWWAERLSDDARERAQLNYLAEIVRHHASNETVVRWQVENEPLFPFGDCPAPNAAFVRREIELVRSLDDRPIQSTVSGELEPWLPPIQPVDIVGFSLYRFTWNELYGNAPYVLPPEYYRLRAFLNRLMGAETIISELQAEPWFSDGHGTHDPVIWYDAFDVEDLERHVDFARRTGIQEIDLWGVEWWYYLKKHGDPRLWEAAKEILNSKH